MKKKKKRRRRWSVFTEEQTQAVTIEMGLDEAPGP